jgi:hypothetical protein
MYRGANKFNTSYVFYNAAAVTSSIMEPIYGHIDPKEGYVLIADAIMFGTAWQGAKGLLCIIEFQITTTPTTQKLNCTLDITNPYTWIAPSTLKNKATFEDGYYEIVPFIPPPPPPGAKISVNPPRIIDPEKVPCTYFEINITIEDVENLKICEFNLTYQKTVIDWTTITVRKIFEQIPSKKVITGDGFIWINLTYQTPITTYDPVAIVTIEFHVESLGATPLDIHDSHFMDSYGQPIPHEEYDGYFATLIQDIAILNITVSRNWAYQGWPINVTVTVKNEGNMPETFNVNASYNNNLIGTSKITDLPPGNETELTFEWNTTTVPEGNYTIKAMAEILPYETDTLDNTRVDGQVWIMALIHDIAIINVTCPYEWVHHTWVVNITVTAKNMGHFTETFDIKAYINTSLIGTYHVAELASDEEIMVTFTWNTSSAEPCHYYRLIGEATLLPYEFNETNNIFDGGLIKVRFLGDLSGDDRVDMEDLYIAAQAFGSSPGHPKWNPIADINLDNRVDMADLYIIAKNFGKRCSS